MSPEELADLMENQGKFEELFNTSTPEQRMSKEFVESPIIKDLVHKFVSKDIKLTIIELIIME